MSGSGNGSVLDAPNLAIIDAITQFVGGTQAVWDTVTVPIPANLVVYATDTTALKIGDGVTLYANLPVKFYLNSLTTLVDQIAALATQLTGNETTTALTSLLANYVTSTALGTTLSGYATTAMVKTKLTTATTLNVISTADGNAAAAQDAIGNLTTPFGTLAGAWNWAQLNLNLMVNQLTIGVASGNFPLFGCNGMFDGQMGLPVIINGAGASTVINGIIAAAGATIQLQNLCLKNTTGYGLASEDAAVVLLGAGITLDECLFAQLSNFNGGYVGCTVGFGNESPDTFITVVGNALSFIQSYDLAMINLLNATVNFANAVSYTNEVFAVTNGGYLELGNVVWQNKANVTGTQYTVSVGGILSTFGTYAALPGTVTGTNTNGYVT